MINNKLISIKRIISKVYSDLGVAEENIPVTDIIKWAAEALEKIEAPTLLTKKVTGKEGIPLLEIKDYQASLPKDLVDIEQVAYSTSKYSSKFYPMVYATGSFSGRHGLTSDIDNEYYEDPNKDDIPSDYSLVSLAQELFSDTRYIILNTSTDEIVATLADKEEAETIANDNDDYELKESSYNLGYKDYLEMINNDADLKSTLTNLLGDSSVSMSYDAGTIDVDKLEYTVVPGYIKTNVKEGYLMMSYTAVPTDEEGFPMIPDHMSFIDAVYWYVNMKIRYLQMATEGTRIAQTLFQHAESKWRFYVRQAYGKAMMPSGVGQFEALKNQWLRLMPTPNEAETFFQYLNTKEELKY